MKKKTRRAHISFKLLRNAPITQKVGLSHGTSGPHGEQTNICPRRKPNTGFSGIEPLASHNETKAQNLQKPP